MMAIKIDYAVQESITNIRRNLFMTFAAVLVVAVSLALGGGALLIKSSIQKTAAIWTGNVRVTIFLDDDFSAERKAELDEQLRAMPEVATVRFETKQQAFENFKRLFANQPQFVQSATPDALPESFRVELKDPRKFEVIRDQFDGAPGLRVRDERAFVKKLFSFSDTIQLLALIVSGVVLVAALLLIATTIRMAIYARRKEIGIMKLVGATNWFIRIPFMVEGMVQGMIGALAATVLLLLAKWFVFPNVQQDAPIQVAVGYVDVARSGIYLLALGIFLGAMGSVLGLRKFLDV